MSTTENFTTTLKPYYDALNRIIDGSPNIVDKDIKITLNAVAIEAGKTPGSIKKSRDVYKPLIEEISTRAEQQKKLAKPGASQVQHAKIKANKAKEVADDYKSKYEAALARELMLIIAWDDANQELRKGKVVPIRPRARPLADSKEQE